MTKKKQPVVPKLPTITAFDQITPAAAVELYKKHGLKPKPRVLQPSSKGCCVMATVLVEMGCPVDVPIDYNDLSEFEKLFPGLTRLSFEMGFDHALDFVTDGEPGGEEAVMARTRGQPALFCQGYSVGLAVGRAHRLGEI